MRGSFDLALAVAVLLIGTVLFFFAFFSINDNAEQVQQFFDDPVGDVISNDVGKAVGDVRVAQACGWNTIFEQVRGLMQSLAVTFGPTVNGFLLIKEQGNWKGFYFGPPPGNDIRPLGDELVQYLGLLAEDNKCPNCFYLLNNQDFNVQGCCSGSQGGNNQPGQQCSSNSDCQGNLACINGQCEPCNPGNGPAGKVFFSYDFDSSFFADLNQGFIRLTSNSGTPGVVGCEPCPAGSSQFDFCGCPPNTAPDGLGGCTQCRPGYGGSYGNCDTGGEGSTGSEGQTGTEGANGSSGSTGTTGDTGSNGIGANGSPGGSNGLEFPNP